MVSDGPQLLEIPRIQDVRGNLSFLEYPSTLPFEPARSYWIYDIPTAKIRHGHAYYPQQEVIVALSGSFTVHTEHMGKIRSFRLSSPWTGLYIPPMTWRVIDEFSSNALPLVLSSGLYSEADYIREYELYKEISDCGHE